ncbi:hypothetical protein M153_74120001061 [Pseudoloma neurophilia]|uniref:Uncharacterized protein n=1 Tax=Pseudoloma neurophilia TaxID=146866 RepID=A0A0R0LSA2_9MICR|nr:hypothetical protein M153_74120001061 [Pseudoloma neurophilia]
MEIFHHLMPLCILVIEGFNTPINTKMLPFSIFIIPLYYFIAHISNKYNQRWPYPLLENISHLERSKIFIGYGLLGLIPATIFCLIMKRWRYTDQIFEQNFDHDKTKNK